MEHQEIIIFFLISVDSSQSESALMVETVNIFTAGAKLTAT